HFKLYTRQSQYSLRTLSLSTSPPSSDLRSFPPRRSPDLGPLVHRDRQHRVPPVGGVNVRPALDHPVPKRRGGLIEQATVYKCEKSEEHTSELQSRFDLVCRLLLEKKNKTTTQGIRYSLYI